MNSKAPENEQFSPSRKEMPKAEGAFHILVIRLSAMGDVAMVVPVLRTLTTTYPQLKITVLTREFFKPMFAGINNVSVYKADVNGLHSGVFGLGRLAKELRDTGINAVADLHNVLRSNVLKSVFYLYGLPVKQIDKGRAEKKALTRENEKVFKPLKSTHERYVEVFKALGFPVNLEQHQFPQKQKLPEKISEITRNDTRKWLGIAPFAQHQSKAYPQEQMKQVLKSLSEKGRIRIFLFGGGKQETEILQNWESNFENTQCVAGKLSLTEELSLISNLDAMLAMDSGNGHMAAMYGIPVITVWGVTHPYTGFAPFKQPEENWLLPDLERFPKIPTSVYGNKFPEGYEEAIATVSPEMLVDKVKFVLGK